MSQTVCKILAAIVAAALLICCIGCAPEEQPISEMTPLELYQRGIWQENNLNIEYTNENNDAFTRVNISGLADKEVEDAINERLDTVYNVMYTCSYIPLYRGISLKFRDCPGSEKTEYITGGAAFNCNGLLSVTYHCTCTIGGDDYSWFSYTVPMTFDLATGKELTLTDLGGEGCIEELSDAMDEYLFTKGYDADPGDDESYYSGVTMTAPFRGIKPEQKFFINWDGSICLIFDWETPEFYTNCEPVVIYPESGDIAFRAGTLSTDIFEDKSPVYNFTGRNGNGLLAEERVVEVEAEYPDNVVGDRYYFYTTDDPQAVVDVAAKVVTDDEYIPVTPFEAADEARRISGGDDWSMSYDISADIYTYGDYHCVSQYMTYYASSTDDNVWDPITNYMNEQFFQTRGDDARPVELSELFRDGVDYVTLLRDAMVETALAAKPDYPEQAARELADMLVQQITGFMVSNSSLQLSFELTNDRIADIISETLLEATGSGEDAYLIVYAIKYLPYRTLGCENLTVFD